MKNSNFMKKLQGFLTSPLGPMDHSFVSFQFLRFIFIFCVCMYCLHVCTGTTCLPVPACMYTHHVHVWCLERPEEVGRSPGTGTTVMWCLMGPLKEQQVLLTANLSLQSALLAL